MIYIRDTIWLIDGKEFECVGIIAEPPSPLNSHLNWNVWRKFIAKDGEEKSIHNQAIEDSNGIIVPHYPLNKDGSFPEVRVRLL